MNCSNIFFNLSLKHSYLIITLMIAILTSCGQSDSDKIGDAQFCLDKLTIHSEENVNNCVAKLGNLENKESYLIRCNAGFIQEGFSSPTKILDVVDGMTKNGTTNTNPTATILSVLIFKTKTGSTATEAAKNNEDFAIQTQSYCIKSENAGLILISSFASMATSIASATTQVGAGNLFDGSATPQEIASAVSNASPTVLGSTALVAYQTNCTGEIDSSKKDLCSTLSTAITSGNGDAAAIGSSLQQLIGN